MDMIQQGVCSLCRGPVGVPRLWAGTVPPEPTCGKCGAKAVKKAWSVLEMEPAKKCQTPIIVQPPAAT